MKLVTETPKRLLGATALLMLLLVPPALGATATPRIEGIQIYPETGIVELSVKGLIEYSYFRLSEPERLVFDFPDVELAIDDGSNLDYRVQSLCFNELKLSQFSRDPLVSRLVICLTQPAQGIVSYSSGDERLIIQMIPSGNGSLIRPASAHFQEEKDALHLPPSTPPTSRSLDSPFEIYPTSTEVLIRFPGVDKTNLDIQQLRFPDRLHVRIFTRGREGAEKPRFELFQRGNIWNRIARQWVSYIDRFGWGVYDLTIYLYPNMTFSETTSPDGIHEVHIFPRPPELAQTSSNQSEIYEIEVSAIGSPDSTKTQQQTDLSAPPVLPEPAETNIQTASTEIQPEPNDSIFVAQAVEISAEAPQITITDHSPTQESSSRHIERQREAPREPTIQEVKDNLLEGVVQSSGALEMKVGEVAVIPVHNLVRASIGNPNVGVLNVISQNELLVTALAPGSTTILTWEEGVGHRARELHVTDATRVRENEIAQLINDPNIKVKIMMAGETPGIILEGAVATEEERERARSIAALYAGADRVTNLIEVTDPRQVMVKVRVVEIEKRALDENLSHFSAALRTDTDDISFGIITDILDPENPGGGLVDTRVRPGVVNGDAQDVVFDPIDVMLKRLESTRQARILSEPNVVAMSGHPAHFRVGGEIPYTYVNENGYTVVDFREFGIQLDILPQIDSQGNIQLEVTPIVRTPDLALAIAGIPGFRTREMKTNVQLREGETLVIGGLIQREVTKVESAVPILSQIPIIGELFKSKRFNEDETELVIFLSPYLINSQNLSSAEQLVGVNSQEILP